MIKSFGSLSLPLYKDLTCSPLPDRDPTNSIEVHDQSDDITRGINNNQDAPNHQTTGNNPAQTDTVIPQHVPNNWPTAGGFGCLRVHRYDVQEEEGGSGRRRTPSASRGERQPVH
ncbi:hypothetical protein N658DRAFT_247855 [Parathielavia hyrcaniae]|uniref:Uncharacterized protein n=1 Tax=Parathielavia hyrcaniae TaxID=113614 RepID=A0AAN6Q622_9PEZI|nr:hypothetical protein N658DRAFT_247855 [Parathielavia hyrcaniae]